MNSIILCSVVGFVSNIVSSKSIIENGTSKKVHVLELSRNKQYVKTIKIVLI